ncbi:GL13029 [Drosophila persimilis]|uniref:GL13029 n=1 Tax=Drosophila persimilis TaxID=7234 RepID=B4GVI2_DROPE|nr:GL13029 [Drosophila persimilis]
MALPAGLVSVEYRLWVLGLYAVVESEVEVESEEGNESSHSAVFYSEDSDDTNEDHRNTPLSGSLASPGPCG